MNELKPRAARGFKLPVAIALGALALLLLLAVLITGASLWYWPQLPPLDKVTHYQPRQHLQIFTADGVEIAQFGSERRLFVPIAQVPALLQQAVLAIEDTQFRAHSGISWRGLVRATLANLSGGMPQGASTITQQVARTFFLSTRRTAERKIKEALLALQIESRLSKDQILELYLNQIYLGQRAYGFGAAAQVYFGKPLDALTLAETTMLAGLPQNPIYANPVVNAERARRRQGLVLTRMLNLGLIKQSQYQQALDEKLVLRSPGQIDVHAQHVAEMARQAVYERFGEETYSQGLRVITTLRAADQEAAHAAVRRALLAHERRQPWRGPEDQEDLPAAAAGEAALELAAAQALKDHRDDEDLRLAVVTAASPTELRAQLASGETVRLSGEGLAWAQRALGAKAPAATALQRGSVIRVTPTQRGKKLEWSIAQWPQAEAAYVALDPVSGRIRALVGGFDFNRRPFNHATQAQRQPGSAIKPFLVSAAFEHGVLPETAVDDLPLRGANGGVLAWNPQNADGRYDGPITVRDALVRSKNLVSVRLVQQVGLADTQRWLARFGFTPEQMPGDLTLALGSGSTTPLQLAEAYAVLANGGHAVRPVLIERILDARGKLLFEAPAPALLTESTRVLPERNTFLVNSVLNDVTRLGTAARAQAALQRSDLYGKTGTTNENFDAWFAGFQPSLVGVAWVGYDQPRSLGDQGSGSALALPIWIDSMAVALRGVPETPVPTPRGVVRGVLDWRYDEWARGGAIERIGGNSPPPPAGPPLR